MNITEQEVFLRLTLKWLMQSHFSNVYNIHPYDWREDAAREYSTIYLGEVYDNFYSGVNDIFNRGQIGYLNVHNARIWMMLYERWCDDRLANPPSDNGLVTMDEAVAERYVSSRGWSLEVGATMVEGGDWWGKRNGNFGSAYVLGDVTRLALRQEHQQFSIG